MLRHSDDETSRTFFFSSRFQDPKAVKLHTTRQNQSISSGNGRQLPIVGTVSNLYPQSGYSHAPHLNMTNGCSLTLPTACELKEPTQCFHCYRHIRKSSPQFFSLGVMHTTKEHYKSKSYYKCFSLPYLSPPPLQINYGPFSPGYGRFACRRQGTPKVRVTIRS